MLCFMTLVHHLAIFNETKVIRSNHLLEASSTTCRKRITNSREGNHFPGTQKIIGEAQTHNSLSLQLLKMMLYN